MTTAPARILILGSGGSGKSTLARRIGERLALPVIHLDQEYWRPGWVESDRAEWTAHVAELVARDRWVIDGNYGGTMELRLAAADTVIFLDLPRRTCLRRAIGRRMQYHGRTRPDMAPDCPERLTWEFVQWIWRFPAANRPAILERLAAVAPPKRVVILRSPREVEEFVARLVRAH